MNKTKVAILKYDSPGDSVARILELSHALDKLKPNDNVFIKPNVVFWAKKVQMPPWGVITTTRVITDIVKILRDYGVGSITIGEGTLTMDPSDRETPAHAFESLGYNDLAKRFDIKIINTFEQPFRSVDLGDGINLNFAEALLDSDFVVDIPVLKTHAQAKVSLSQKNLKGCLDIESRKTCHAGDLVKDLDYYIAKLSKVLPPCCALIDGIYSLERGPSFNGSARRSNILIASSDLLAADMVGAKVLGFEPSEIPHLVHACKGRGLATSLDWLDIFGEPIDAVASPHKWDFPYDESGNLPLGMARKGITGIYYPRYDNSLCTYCSGVTGMIQMFIMQFWNGKPFDEVEVLTGKIQRPRPNMNHTLLLGKCQIKLNKDHKNIKNPITVPGCPPDMKHLAKGLKKIGIDVPQEIFDSIDLGPALFMKKYEGKPEFSMDFFKPDKD